jgi:hypothetical protein
VLNEPFRILETISSQYGGVSESYFLMTPKGLVAYELPTRGELAPRGSGAKSRAWKPGADRPEQNGG